MKLTVFTFSSEGTQTTLLSGVIVPEERQSLSYSLPTVVEMKGCSSERPLNHKASEQYSMSPRANSHTTDWSRVRAVTRVKVPWNVSAT